MLRRWNAPIALESAWDHRVCDRMPVSGWMEGGRHRYAAVNDSRSRAFSVLPLVRPSGGLSYPILRRVSSHLLTQALVISSACAVLYNLVYCLALCQEENVSVMVLRAY